MLNMISKEIDRNQYLLRSRLVSLGHICHARNTVVVPISFNWAVYLIGFPSMHSSMLLHSHMTFVYLQRNIVDNYKVNY